MKPMPMAQLRPRADFASAGFRFGHENSVSPPSPRKSDIPSKGLSRHILSSPSRAQMLMQTSSTTGMAVVVPSSWEDTTPGLWQEEMGNFRTVSGEHMSFALASDEFDFSASFSEVDGPLCSPTPMSSADDLFVNGQIRPLRPLPNIYQQPPSMKQAVASESDDVPPFDFRRSAQYSLPASVSRRSPQKQDQSKLVYAPNKTEVHEVQLRNSSSEEKHRRRSGKRQRVPSDEAKNRATEGRPSLAADNSVSGDRDGLYRRARSLSPLRDLDMNDQPRISCESEEPLFHASSVDEKQRGKQRRQHSVGRSKGWTLKDLLRMGDGKVHNRGSFQGYSESNAVHEQSSKKDQARRKKQDSRKEIREPRAIVPPSRSNYVLRSPKGSVSPHERHYTTQRAQAEQMKKMTFLPYKQVLLGCLGFTSKSHRTAVGMQNLHSFSVY